MTGIECGVFTHKPVPVIFEPPKIDKEEKEKVETLNIKRGTTESEESQGIQIT
jgi:hypothetical protein